MDHDFLSDVADDQPLNQDKLDKLRERVVYARALDLEIDDLEQRLEDKKRELRHLYHTEIPDLMDEAGVDRLGVTNAGNLGSFEIKVQPFYSANIAAGWDPDKRSAAFEYLTELGAEDLIKTKIEIDFSRGERAKAVLVAENLKDDGIETSMKETVHSATLASWLREQVEVNGTVPDLDKIGGTVGRVAKITRKK